MGSAARGARGGGMMSRQSTDIEKAIEKRVREFYPQARVRSRFILRDYAYAVRVVVGRRSALYFVSDMVLRDSWTWAMDSVAKYIIDAFRRPKQWRRMRAN